ncbi:hypothetical protein G3580_18330 [Nitrogeniibacter mangrovi]|uniref:Uncharacterized protein n=1 Tax=Nitrogeniibacter mangrovi TaxID=2016596 RepID=A0A6C1BAI8_9RHOO|nr:hypothetical protein [Nitrogeniibacter mangrovi]QID19400.1 hypothetical protein G3580_18330 [Nitrogeniibacter mangrovi]
MSDHFIDNIINKLRLLGDVGSRKLDDGTLLINENLNRRPGDSPYWHVFYAPLNDGQIARLENRIERKLPIQLRDLLHHSNGGLLFQDSFSWQGLREGHIRDPDVWLPVSMECGNVVDRPLEQDSGRARFADNGNQIRFGIYVEFDSEVMMRLDGDPRVYAVPRYRIGPAIYEWKNLEEFFVSEVDRMIDLSKSDEYSGKFFKPIPPPWMV